MKRYIYYHFNQYMEKEHSPIFQQDPDMLYSEFKIKQRFNLSKVMLKKKLKQIFQPEIDKLLNKNTNEEEFLDLLNDIQKDVLGPAAKSMTKRLAMGEYGYKQVNSLKENDIKTYQTVLDNFQKIFSKLEVAVENTNVVKNIALPSKGTDSDKRKEFRQKYLGDNYIINTRDQDFKRAASMRSKDLANIEGNIQYMKKLIDNKNSLSSIESESFKGLIGSTEALLNKVIGFFSEDALESEVNDYVFQELNKYVSNNVSISASTVGTQSSKTNKFKMNTTDIKLDLSTTLSDESSVSVNLPGVSVKRTKSPVSNTKISMKTNATMKAFLDEIKNQGGESELYKFYNTFATYNMAPRRANRNGNVSTDPAELNKSNFNINNLYNYFKAAALPYALSGSLNQNDFAYFLVINDKVVNALEVFMDLQNDFSKFGDRILSNLSSVQNTVKNTHAGKYQNAAWLGQSDFEKRSQEMIQLINNQKINLQLMIDLTKIKTQ